MRLTLRILGTEVLSLSTGEPDEIEEAAEVSAPGRLGIASDVQLAPAFGFASYADFFEDPVDPEI